MKKWILAMVLLPLVAINALAETDCENVHQKVKDGIYFKYAIKAINVLDNSDQIDQVISFRVGMTDTLVRCPGNHTADYRISAGPFLKLIFPTKTLTARSYDPVEYKFSPFSIEGYFFASASVHQSAMAWIIQSAGFDTFEAEGTGTTMHLRLTPQIRNNLLNIKVSENEEPGFINNGQMDLLGTATIGTNTYQVFWIGTKAYLNP